MNMAAVRIAGSEAGAGAPAPDRCQVVIHVDRDLTSPRESLERRSKTGRTLKVPEDVGGAVWADWWNSDVFGGTGVDAYTALPSWNGDPVDYCAAVGALITA